MGSVSKIKPTGGGRLFVSLGISLILTISHWGGKAWADRIMLRGGGQIHGKLIAMPDDPDHLTFVGVVGKNPIIYKPEQIIQIYPEKSDLDEYARRRVRERTLAEEEYQLAVWCDEHNYKDLATYHFETAIQLDPKYGPAHEKLGHSFNDGRWLDADEQREAMGMIKHHGRWIMAEERDRIEEQEAQAAENQSWVRRIKIYRDVYVANQDTRAKDAERRLLAIREAVAVGPVARILGTDPNPAVRHLGARVLGVISGPEASSALVSRLLAETDGNVRDGLIVELARRDAHETAPRLVQALRSKQVMIINRAAWALGRLNVVTAVPQLIPALTSTEYRTEMIPVAGGNGGGGIGASFNSVAPTGGGVGFGNYTASSYVVPTPAVVAPGAVAYGAVGLPLINGVALGSGGVNNGISFGGGNNGPSMVPRVVPIQHPNVEVRDALTKLTGQDFGFNVGTWKQWAASSFRSDPTPSRRVINP